MSRKEEIEQASVNYQMAIRPNAIGGNAFADMIYKANINPAFVAGAKWADKTLIVKACEWLEKYSQDYVSLGSDDDGELCLIYRKKDLIEEFKQAMTND